MAVLGLLAGCGTESTKTAQPTTFGDNYILPRSLLLSPMQSLFLAFDRSKTDPKMLVKVIRERPLNEFEELVEPDTSNFGAEINSIVTGLGIYAVDMNQRPLKITLGIKARRYDPQTGRFTRDTRIFSAPGQTFENTQEFVIRNEENPNIVMTGLGLRLREGTVTSLFLQRKPMNGLEDAGSYMPEDTVNVAIDPGWAAIGFYIRFKVDSNQYDMTKPAEKQLYLNLTRAPFLEDTLFYSAQLAEQ